MLEHCYLCCVNIEEAIKQTKPFENPYEKAIVNMLYTNSWLIREMQEFYKNHGITGQQYNILRILKGANRPVTNSFIRERLIEKLADVSRIVERLSTKSLVIKKSCKTDKRLVDVSLTEDGLDLLKKIDHKRAKMFKIFSHLTIEEIELLNTLLDRIRSKK